jgi:signal peptidase I
MPDRRRRGLRSLVQGSHQLRRQLTVRLQKMRSSTKRGSLARRQSDNPAPDGRNYVRVKLRDGRVIEGWKKDQSPLDQRVLLLDVTAAHDLAGNELDSTRADSFIPTAHIRRVETLDGEAPPHRQTVGDQVATKPSRLKSVVGDLRLVGISIVIAIVLKAFLLEAFYIPSTSMEPTLEVGDRVLVEKVSYRLGGPARGDVVVFERHSNAGTPNPGEDAPFWEDIVNALRGLFGFPTANSQDYIKRVIAVGGDTVEGRNGMVLVNGDRIREPYLAEEIETTPFGPVSVPEGMIFVMGDNRDASTDSRSLGPVPASSIIGHAFLVVWPATDLAAL